jgi:hypothetical protein
MWYDISMNNCIIGFVNSSGLIAIQMEPNQTSPPELIPGLAICWSVIGPQFEQQTRQLLRLGNSHAAIEFLRDHSEHFGWL